MSVQEKVTLNIGRIDLAKIDYLVEQGFYSNRSDFMRTAIRQQLRTHDAVVSDEALDAKFRLEEMSQREERVKSAGGICIMSVKRKEWEKLRSEGVKVRYFIIGALILDKTIDLELATSVVASAKIYGTVAGDPQVVGYLKHMHQNK